MASSLVPLMVAVAAVAAATSAHHRLPPHLVARFATAGVAVLALVAYPTTALVAASFVAHSSVLGGHLGWCASEVAFHGSIPVWVGVTAISLVVAGALRTALLVRNHRQLRIDVPHPIHITDSAKPYAVTLPGRAGQIIVSAAMFDMLDERERGVVLAHERAHAEHRHDRYLFVAELAAAAFPPLRWLARRVTYAIERWADEVTASQCGDRRFIAVTLGKVAMHQHSSAVAGFSGVGVAARVRALLAPPAPPAGRRQMVLRSAILGAAALAGFYQLQYAEHLSMTLCQH